MSTATAVAITPEALLDHWQGHRRLTRRVIEAYPEDQLFTYSLGGMRTFGALVMEMLSIAGPMVRGVLSGDWGAYEEGGDTLGKDEILRLWDETTAEMDTLFPQIPPERFQEEMLAFGQFPGQGYSQIWYAIDNEVHHRAQGYVYLRTLGIEPPAFYER